MRLQASDITPLGSCSAMKQVEIRLIISQSLILRPFASKSCEDGVGLVINILILGPTTVLPDQCFLGIGVQESIFQNNLASQVILMLIKITFLVVFFFF